MSRNLYVSLATCFALPLLVSCYQAGSPQSAAQPNAAEVSNDDPARIMQSTSPPYRTHPTSRVQAQLSIARLSTNQLTPSMSNALYGVDISKWNATILDRALSSGLIHFVILRATYGRSPDPTFEANWQKLNASGIPHGAYHFYLVSQPPTGQLQTFLRLYSRSGNLALPPIVDFEELSFSGADPALPLTKVQGDLLLALQHLEEVTGEVPILYTDVPTGNRYLNDSRFSRFPLYIADWTQRNYPTLPDAWMNVGFRFWQRSSTYYFEGAPDTAVDLDVFFGDVRDLLRRPMAP